MASQDRAREGEYKGGSEQRRSFLETRRPIIEGHGDGEHERRSNHRAGARHAGKRNLTLPPPLTLPVPLPLTLIMFIPGARQTGKGRVGVEGTAGRESGEHELHRVDASDEVQHNRGDLAIEEPIPNPNPNANPNPKALTRILKGGSTLDKGT